MKINYLCLICALIESLNGDLKTVTFERGDNISNDTQEEKWKAQA